MSNNNKIKPNTEKTMDALFDKWVDEYFSNSSVDLGILRKAFNNLVDKITHLQ